MYVSIGEHTSTSWISADLEVNIGKGCDVTSVETFGALKLGAESIAFECCSATKFECDDDVIIQKNFSGGELKIGKNCRIEEGIIVEKI